MESRKLNPKNLTVGQELPFFEVKVESQIYRKYNRLIKEINPIHFNKKYAQNLGYETIVVAGNFLFTFIPKWIIDWIGAENVSAIKNINVKFENPVYPDDKIMINGKIVNIEKQNDNRIIECEYIVKKANEENVFRGNVILNFSN